MQVDTDVFAALTERAAVAEQLAGEVAVLGRKVSTLTGRVTIMGRHLAHLDGILDDQLTGLTRIISIFLGAGPRHAPRHAAGRDRHGLRAVNGGKR
jgi:hypothetical protein